jgi:hypothetical protein
VRDRGRYQCRFTKSVRPDLADECGLKLLADICFVQSSFHARALAGSAVLHSGPLRGPNISA